LFYHNLCLMPEDVYFVKHLKKIEGVTLPTQEVASKFSSEEILNEDSIGFHKVWSYHKVEDILRYFRRY